jgi:hypothetical protein
MFHFMTSPSPHAPQAEYRLAQAFGKKRDIVNFVNFISEARGRVCAPMRHTLSPARIRQAPEIT